MPSDAKKKRDAKKKEAAKLRAQQRSQNPKNAPLDEDEDRPATPMMNGVVNGNDKGAVANGLDGGVDEGSTSSAATAGGDPQVNEAIRHLQQVEIDNANARSCTGVLSSHPRSRDLKIDHFNLTFYGHELIRDSKIELSYGNRYGLVGLNGSGKSSFFQAMANREVPIPDSLDIFLLSREVPGTEQTALEAVMEADELKAQLEREAEELAQDAHDDDAHDKLMDIYDRLDEMSADTAEARAAEILHNLGFKKAMQQKKCKEFSGGWRMRIALARALYLKPTLLLLDEPTNHLDLNACVWLEEELKTYKRILVIISHSQDFMNSVCTDIIHLTKNRLQYYGGNYDTFVRTRLELLENQMKRFNWEQAQMAHMKNYIARFGHGTAKMARQAQSREKQLKRMMEGGLTEKVINEQVKEFGFIDPGVIPPPVIMVQNVSFRYTGDTPWIYKNLDFGIDMDTRLALVGPNGAGKSTLLKLIAGENEPSAGLIRRHSHVKMGRYHQHLHEQLDLSMSALEHMQKCFPDIVEKEEFRKIVGRYGITGRQQTCPMKQLSDGQRCRVSFAWLAWQRPHLLLLDEPTNHLDMETIDVLADALNEFEGGMLLVSHDFRLISQVADVIWICEKETVTKFEGDIFEYKELLRKKIERQRRKAAANALPSRRN